jgi:hypothetical protein
MEVRDQLQFPPIYTQEIMPVPIKQKAEGATKLAWTFRRRQKSPVRIRTPDPPSPCKREQRFEHRAYEITQYNQMTAIRLDEIKAWFAL